MIRGLSVALVLGFALSLASSADSADLTFGPYLQDVKTDGIVVCWVTSSPLSSTVEYGLTSAYGSTVSDATPVKEHQIELAGLLSGALYHYKVASGSFAATGTFKTAVTGSASFTFVHMAETHTEPEVADFAEEIAAADPHLIVDCSDQVDKGMRRDQWDDYFTFGASYYPHAALLAAVGNHTYQYNSWLFIPGSFGKREFKKVMHNPNNEEWYSVRCGNTLFIALNSTWYFEKPSRILGTQVRWLEEELKAATDGADDPTFKVVFMHIPMQSSGPKYREYIERIVLRFFFKPVFEKYGVDLVLSGHDKITEHSARGGVHYVQVASGEVGNPLETTNGYSLFLDSDEHTIMVGEVGASSIVCKIVDLAGTVMHSFTVTP